MYSEVDIFLDNGKNFHKVMGGGGGGGGRHGFAKSQYASAYRQLQVPCHQASA